MTTHQHRTGRLGQLSTATLDVDPAAYRAATIDRGSLRLERIELQLDPDQIAALVASLDADAPADVNLPTGEIPWRATVMMTDTETGDGRLFDASGGAHRDLPLPLMANLETTFGHDGAFLAGRIDTLELGNPRVAGAGVFADTDEARVVAAHIAAGNIRGISADLDDLVADYEATVYDDDGFPIDYLFHASQWRIMGATVTPFPAFAECAIELAVAGDTAPAEPADEPVDDEQTDAAAAAAAVVAAGGPARPPAVWFDDPQLSELTAPQFDDDGRCFGHLAPWHECHIAFEDACTCAPRSSADYAYMRTGYVVTDTGDTVPVGQLTMATGHADLSLTARAAVAHYDDTGTAFADCAFGEDDHGIWFAGAIRPNVDEDALRTIRCSALSGDWRPIGGSLELVAALAVNVPGFPVPRARVAGGQQLSLVASAGGPVMARMVEHQHEFVPRVELDVALERLAALEQRVGTLTSTLGDDVRDRLLQRIG